MEHTTAWRRLGAGGLRRRFVARASLGPAAHSGAAGGLAIQVLPGDYMPIPVPTKAVPTGDGWVHEVKFDGYRVQGSKATAPSA
jgi:ATP-dependent DNA ligase